MLVFVALPLVGIGLALDLAFTDSLSWMNADCCHVFSKYPAPTVVAEFKFQKRRDMGHPAYAGCETFCG
jgi:hypothetical protein